MSDTVTSKESATKTAMVYVCSGELINLRKKIRLYINIKMILLK